MNRSVALPYALALFAVALALPARAAPPDLKIPAELVPVDGYAVYVPTDDVKGITYIGRDGAQPFPAFLLADKRTFVLPVQGLAAGRYKFTAVASRNDEHTKADFTVVVGNPPAPPPIPPSPPNPGPPNPPPPDPVDPLSQRVHAALVADPGSVADKKGWATALAGFYAAMAAHVRDGNVNTVGDLLSDYRAAIPTVLPDTAIQGTRKACGQEVSNVAGDDSERQIDADLKAKLVDLFLKLSKALAIEGAR